MPNDRNAEYLTKITETDNDESVIVQLSDYARYTAVGVCIQCNEYNFNKQVT